MQHIGNTEDLKKSIKSFYTNEIKRIQKENARKISLMMKKKDEILHRLGQKIEDDTAEEEKKEIAKIKTEKILESKNRFEDKREEYIRKVIDSIKKDRNDITESKEYIQWIKKNFNKKDKIKATASTKNFSKEFPDIEIKIDKSIIGIRFIEKDIEYDFTLDTLITNKEEELTLEINKILFGGVDV